MLPARSFAGPLERIGPRVWLLAGLPGYMFQDSSASPLKPESCNRKRAGIQSGEQNHLASNRAIATPLSRGYPRSLFQKNATS